MRRAAWRWLAAVLALWGAAGCTCGQPPVESELVVAFERPLDGARLAATQDEDVAEGFQYDVEVAASDTAGRQVRLAGATLETRAASDSEWAPGPEAVLEGSRARFARTALGPRSTLLRVTVVEEGSRRTAARTVSVTLGAETPSLELASPAEGQVLREADDADAAAPGYQVRFDVKATGLAGRQGTLYCEGALGLAPADFSLSASGEAQVWLTLGRPACEAQVASCHARVRKDGRDVTSGRREVTLDTVAPRVVVAAPVAPLPTTTFAVEAAVGCVEPGRTATLSRPGAPDLTAQVVAGGVRFPAVTVPVDGDYGFTLWVADEGGNVTTREVPVTVASTAPALQLRAPRTLTEDAVDGRLDNGVQALATVRVDGLPVGTEVELFTSVSGQFARPQRAPTLQGTGERVATFRVELAEGDNTLRACVRNVAGLQTCASQLVTVSTGRPGCRIASPPQRALHASTTAPLKVRVEAEASPISVRALDTSGALVAQADGGAVDLVLPRDGEYLLLATCGAGTSQRVAVGVDTTPPELLAVDVAGLPPGTTVLGPEVPDTSPLPGMQLALDVRTEPRATVQALACGQAVPVAAQADASGLAVVREVTVPPSGACEVRVTSRDLAGNTSERVLVLRLALVPGTLRFESPPSDRYLGAGDGTPRPGGGLTVTVRLALEPTADGSLRLLRDTQEVALQPVLASDRAVAFADVALEEGANLLRAELSGPQGVEASASVLLLVDTTPVPLRFRVPAPPPAPAVLYNVGSDLNPEVPGIQRPLEYEAPERSASATVDLCADVALGASATPCADGSGWYTLASNVPPYSAQFTYPEGRYALKAVLRDGALSESEPVSLTVDSTEPRVRTTALPQDTLPAATGGDGRLNAVELPEGVAPQVRVEAEGLEDGRPVQVRSASNLGVVYGQGTVTGGQATVALTSLPTGVEARYEAVVTVTDAAGNSNRVASPTPLYPLNSTAFLSFRVDRVAPSLVVGAPTRAILGPADDASPAEGFQLRATVNTSADVGEGGVRMELAPPGLAVDVTPVDLVATQDFTVPAAGTVDYTLTLVAVDRSGNPSAPDTRPVRVDLAAPTLTPVSPTANTTYTATELPVRVDVGDGEGLTVRIFSRNGAGTEQEVGALPVVSGVAQGLVNFPRGVQTVIFSIVDEAGNPARAQVAGVNVDVPGCSIALSDPAGTPVTLLARDDRDGSTPGLQYRLLGATPQCAGRAVSLYRGSATVAEQTVTAEASTGGFTFDVTLADGEQTRLTVEVLDSDGRRAFDAVDVTVDITVPAFSALSPSAARLYFVADSNAFLFPVPATDRVVDLVPDGDANAELSLTVLEAVGGSVRAFYAGAPVSSQFPLSSSPESLTVPVTLPQGTTGQLEVRLRDASGNEVVRAMEAVVDVVPPAAPAVTRVVVPGQERTARVRVEWTASGDDGLTGTPEGYDLRWTTNALLKDGITDEQTFFDTTRVRQETGALLPPGTTSHTLTLPPLARYSLQLRPRDEVGNYARFSAEPVASQLSNFWRQVTLTSPGGNGYALYVNGRGDLNADGRDDLVVSAASTAPGRAYVYFGTSDPATEAPVSQSLTMPEQFFGADLDLGDVGNEVDVVADLALGSRSWLGASGTNTGRAFLYFGRKDTTLDPVPIEIQGAVAGGFFGGAVKLVDDLTGDGLRELLISAHGENKVYLFFGRSVAAWRELGGAPGTPCGGATACIVPASRADRVFTGESGMVFFGRLHGYARLGDLTGDGVADFTVPASSERHNKLFVHSGATVLARASLDPTDALQTLFQGPNTTSNSISGFGVEALGGVHLVGASGATDLAVSKATTSQVFLYADGAAGGFTSAPTVMQGGGRFGFALAGADLDGNGHVDLAIGQNLFPGGSAFVFYNSGSPGAEFDLVQGTGFRQSKLESDSALGISLDVLDFNGDGRPDLAVGDSQSSPARVVVYY